MLITKPHYYDSFRCIAGSCPDSCCKEWDVQVDDVSAAYYRSLPGALGEDLRRLTVCAASRQSWVRKPCAKPAGNSPV